MNNSNIMNKNRQESLKIVIDKLTRIIHDMHSGQSFPFGNIMLGRQQVMILFFIYEKKSLASVKEIAKFLHVTPGAVTQFVDGLVEKKLVRREESLDDRRCVNIKLSLEAEKKFDSFKSNYLMNASLSFVDFSDNDLEKFTKLLNKIKTSSI